MANCLGVSLNNGGSSPKSAGTSAYLAIMGGTLVTRFLVSLLALPFLYGYLYWQSKWKGVPLENRPVLAILRQVAEIEVELSEAQQEIARRKQAEAALKEAQTRLIQQERMAAVGQLTTGLAHVFNNLLADGGTISITMGNVQAQACCAVCQRPVRGEWVRLAVADDGEGMEPANLPRVFEPFFTTRSPLRNGLGLSQIVGIVKQHDGHIEVTSQVSKGTVVSIYLPPVRALLAV